MLPNTIAQFFKKEADYVRSEYPETQDCIQLERQVLAISSDIERLANYPQGFNKESKITGALAASVVKKNMSPLLQEAKNEKEKLMAALNCGIKKETKQDEPLGNIPENKQEKSGKNILEELKSHRYAYIAVGSALVLAVLYFSIKK